MEIMLDWCHILQKLSLEDGGDALDGIACVNDG
jgi:hypothetical protein